MALSGSKEEHCVELKLRHIKLWTDRDSRFGLWQKVYCTHNNRQHI